jgi:hypothetical protein
VKRKSWIAALLCLLIVSEAAPAAHAYIPKQDEKADGASNIMLVYAGYYDPRNYNGQEIGVWDREKFLPYVAHLNERGRPDDAFFDSFLFLGLKTPLGGSLHRYYSWVQDSHPGTKADWEWILDRMFVKNQQLDALDQAVRQVGAQLHDPDMQVKVYMVLPFPDSKSTQFGDLDGDGQTDSLESLENRNKAVSWYIDEFIRRFQAANFAHLKLSGFYWMQEDLDTSVPGELDNIRYTVGYLHDRGLKLGWIPWSGAAMKGQGNAAGFDFTIIQPNHYMNANTTIDRIRETADLANRSGEGVEMEFDARVLESPWHLQAMRDYLIGGVMYGYMNQALTAYYQDVYGLYDLYHSDNPRGRQLYDDVYRFAKGIYTPPTGNLQGRVVDADGHPLAGARIASDGRETFSDSDGYYRFDGLYAVDHTFTVTKAAYGEFSFTVGIAAGQTAEKDAVLAQIPVEHPDDPKIVLDDFEGDVLRATADNAKSLSINTDPRFVASGTKSLKADFTTQFRNFRVYLKAGASYTQTDWSGYDAVTADVYNPTSVTQYVDLEFLDNALSWGRSYSKRFELAPNGWTHLSLPIQEIAKAPNFNIHDVRQMSFNQKLQDPYHLPNTLYIDNVHLVRYRAQQTPDYAVKLPAQPQLLDIGQSLAPQVVERNTGEAVPNADVRYTTSDPVVIHVNADGTLTAVGPGTATIYAKVGEIAALSATVEVSSWTKFDLQPQNDRLQVGETSKITAKANFQNGFAVPFAPEDIIWNVEGDGLLVTSQQGATLSFQAVSKGVVWVEATLRYNGKTMKARTKLQIK